MAVAPLTPAQLKAVAFKERRAERRFADLKQSLSSCRTYEGEGWTGNKTFVVVRTGNTIASFSALNVGGTSSFPADLIAQQVERLRAAQRTGAPQ
ncbi:hypothetical protein DRB96_11455 [Streptomyces sp. ICC1]|nr:hypothetical protein DRB89_04915 [Streptomyces sp. ICC4]AWZ12843.1 hypothetical protein DRB96_11455 [Streptomyces sp. ICC1]